MLLGSIYLLAAMSKAGCDNIVSSSSATVYFVLYYLPYDEAHPTNPLNSYGRTNLIIERLLGKFAILFFFPLNPLKSIRAYLFRIAQQ